MQREITRELVRRLLPGRMAESNKGSYGSVLAAAGSMAYRGAAALCTEGALRGGAGLVYLASVEPVIQLVLSRTPECCACGCRTAANGGSHPQDADALSRWFADRHAVLLAGPGWGESAADGCKALLGRNAPWAGAVLDADALNALAAGKYRGDLPANTILTPHPGEAARLLGLTAPPQEGLDDYTAAPYRLSYPVYYDLEDKYFSGVFPSEMAEITQAFFDRLTEYGYTGAQGLYASRNWVRARMTDPAFDKWRDNLWIARFSDDLDYAGTYDMWQCTFSAPGADYGVQSETVDLDFVMRPFKFTGVSACNGKTAAPVLLNDTYTDELHMDGKDAYATLATNEPGKEDGGRRVYWTTSDKTVATVDKNGTVRARTDSGECTITATLADGTESLTCRVRVGDITVPIFATAGLRGDRATLADAAALKGATPDSILLDAGDSLHGTESASLTGGMDMLSAFSAAGYALHAMALTDFAYGTTRLVSDANMGSGPSLASNLLNNEGTAVFYRSTSWSRNRVTNGRYTVVERAGYKIGFFVLNDPAQAAVISASNGEFITARDWNDTAAEQITALQNAGCDAILAIASTAPAGDWQKALLRQGVTAIIDGTTAENGTNVLGADLGLTGVAQLDLVFTQGGGCRVELRQPVAAAEMESRRATWLAMSTADAAQADTAADAADPGKDTEAVGGSDTTAPTETADEAQQAGADAYTSAAAEIATLDADDQSILYTPLFTYAANPDANKTISFGNYLAALYAEIVTNAPATGLPEGASVEAFAGGVTEPEYGEITRGDLMAALPATARIQLVSTTAEAVRALADGELAPLLQNKELLNAYMGLMIGG